MSIELISARCTDKEERYHFKTDTVEYIVYFDKLSGITQTVPIGGEIDKETLKEIMNKLDAFRLSLIEESLTVVE